MKPSRHASRRGAGFTLMEVSAAMGLLLILGSSMVVMVQQHVTFMRFAERQSFLADEAPKTGNLVGRLFSQADHFLVYETLADARSGAAPLLAGGRAARLYFKSAAQTVEVRILAVEQENGRAVLRFHHTLPDGGDASWAICDRLQDATFSAEEGILTLTLFGPNGEEITYGGGAR